MWGMDLLACLTMKLSIVSKAQIHGEIDGNARFRSLSIKGSKFQPACKKRPFCHATEHVHLENELP